jgi:lipoprotein-anchoring transpeptidase ErfK/SrfK
MLTGCNTDTSRVREQAVLDSVAKAGGAAADSAAMLSPVDSAAMQGPPIAGVRLEVDLTARQVRLLRGNDILETHPVAVGSPEWPTRTGEWYVSQVVWNPEWIPPDESWAEEREPRQPGDPANPLGQAQLIYDPPRTIHGTNDSLSIGKAVSHGSIRAHNSAVKALARRLMEETGVIKDEAWYQETQRNRKVKQIVDLPQRVPIRVF